MLTLNIPAHEVYDEIDNLFLTIPAQTLKLEHSLVSISKWEMKWQKPFLSEEPKTNNEIIDYIRCMTIGQPADPMVYYTLSPDLLKQIDDYIASPMTATKITNRSQKHNKPTKRKSVTTNEEIYYEMFALGIPIECEKWHLQRLLTLIKVCSIKQGGQKMSRRETMAYNNKLNAQRKAKYHTKG